MSHELQGNIMAAGGTSLEFFHRQFHHFLVSTSAYEVIKSESTPSLFTGNTGTSTDIKVTFAFSVLPSFDFEASWMKRVNQTSPVSLADIFPVSSITGLGGNAKSCKSP